MTSGPGHGRAGAFRAGLVLMALAASSACSRDRAASGPPEGGAPASGEAAGAAPTPAQAPEAPALADHPTTRTGMYVYMADAARFTDCAGGTSYPVAMEGASVILERAYLDARPGPGAPVLVTLRAHIASRPGMEGGTEDALVVDSVETVTPGGGCGGVPDAALEGTTWVLTDITDAPPVPSGAEASLRLDAESGSVTGNTGCGGFSGSYDLAGGRLHIQPVEVSRACTSDLSRLETDFLEALRLAGSYRIRGDTLELMGERGVVARLVGETSRAAR